MSKDLEQRLEAISKRQMKHVEDALKEVLRRHAPVRAWLLEKVQSGLLSRVLGFEVEIQRFTKTPDLYRVYLGGKMLGDFRALEIKPVYGEA